MSMRVCKRDKSFEEVSFDKVLKRLKNLIADNDDLKVNVFELAQKVCSRIYDGVKTSELDELAAHLCSSMIVDHPDYGLLASRIIVSNHHKNTSPSFSETISILYNHYDDHNIHNPLVSETVYKVVEKHKEKLNSCIEYSRDYDFDYFGFKTLEKGYLMKVNGKCVERPQHMLMRVSLGIHGTDIKDAIQTYDCLSRKLFIHATPTLFNSGTPRPQNSSCFLLANHDSIEGIFETLKECALISKYAGGIGMHVSKVRAKGSRIRGTNGMSDGIVPMLRVYNNAARYVNQCFTPDTLVYSLNGVVTMDQVNTNDYLMTKDGSYQRVNGVKKSSINKPILQIRTRGSFVPITVTNEHDIYVHGRGFVKASDLSVGDLVGHPIPDYSAIEENEFDGPTVKFMATMLRHGSFMKSDSGNSNNNCVEVIARLTFKKCSAENEFLKGYLSDKKINDVEMFEQNESVYYDIKFNDLNDPILTGVYDVEKDQMHIHHKLMHLTKEKVYYFLSGIFDEEYMFNCCVPDVLYGIKYMLLRVGMGSFCDKNGICVNKHSLVSEGIVWDAIESIDHVQYSGDVYDFNMCNNHNYTVVNLGLVHNSGRRNGSIAVYLEPWHADIQQFLELKKPHGADEDRARDLFYALWIPDLFMKRVKENGKWSLMCPDMCPGLADSWGDAFDKLYMQYEQDGRFLKQVNAQDLWFKILESQIETGTPYLCYKDSANRKSNQQNLGTIKSSNLCSEIIEYTDENEIAVCNLASVCLPSYVTNDNQFDFELLHAMVKIMTKNLNKVIDVNFYPHPKARVSNLRHRPLGIGVQGLADLFAILKIPFESDAAKSLNENIFETIYHAALESSNEISKKRHLDVDYLHSNTNEFDPPEDSKYPGAYCSFDESPASKGLLQFDLWDIKVANGRYDWDTLKDEIKKYGLRNSLLLAPMPTASTSQICGFNEAFEPFTSNIYKRKTIAGEFILVNKYLLAELIRLGLWNHDMKNNIIINDGSIQNIETIPQDIKDVFKTVWEIKQKCIIDMAADRGKFVCQSQSLNLFVEAPDFKRLSSMHFYAWDMGLKTGIYYLRSKPRAKTQQFTIDPRMQNNNKVNLEEPEVCESCSA